jgi:hypothetical protein
MVDADASFSKSMIVCCLFFHYKLGEAVEKIDLPLFRQLAASMLRHIPTGMLLSVVPKI